MLICAFDVLFFFCFVFLLLFSRRDSYGINDSAIKPFPDIYAIFVYLLICWCILIAIIENNIDPDQVAP